jgi:hypothetical protein
MRLFVRRVIAPLAAAVYAVAAGGILWNVGYANVKRKTRNDCAGLNSMF